MKDFLAVALRRMIMKKIREMQDKQKTKVRTWKTYNRKCFTQKMEELDEKDLGDVWSDSDASNYREEEAQIGLDNAVMNTFSGGIQNTMQ